MLVRRVHNILNIRIVGNNLMNLLSVLLFLRLATLYYCNELDRGYPGGFFVYGDRNGDGLIDKTDIQGNLNLAWLTEWNWITRNKNSRDIELTEIQFNALIGEGIYYYGRVNINYG